MESKIWILGLMLWVCSRDSSQQTTHIPKPNCIDYIDAVRCFKSFDKTMDFSVALRTCHGDNTYLPIIAMLEERQTVVDRSLPLNMVPFWVDLRSLTQAELLQSGSTIKYKICAVGRPPAQSSVISFDFCYTKRKALCCIKLICHPTEQLLTWREAEDECKAQNKTMYGTGATLTEIQARFFFISDCSNCWIGLSTVVTSSWFSDTALRVSTEFVSIPKPGPCAVVGPTGEGRTVPCKGGGTRYQIICETFIKKEPYRDSNTTPFSKCPPEGCGDPGYPIAWDIKLACGTIMVAGLPICISFIIIIGYMHRRKNPIYTRMPENRMGRQHSQISSYVPGGTNNAVY